MPYNYSTTDVFSILQDLEARVAAQEAEGPAPQPVFFVQQPSVNPLTGTAGQTTYTATPGVLSNGATPSRAWLLGSTVLATTLSYAPPSDVTGTIIYQETGAGGVQSNPVSVVVNADAGTGPVTPTLTLSGPLTYTDATAAGATVAFIGNVPTGVTPTFTPDDDRLELAGSQGSGWRIIRGAAASSAGTYQLTVSAAGANSASATITVSVATQTPTLALTGPLSYAADAAAGTTVANIGNVPSGATPTISPNDGRLVVAGNQTNGWRVVKGMSASTQGSFTLTVSAPGANSTSQTITVTAATTVPTQPFAAFAPNSETQSYSAAMTTAPSTSRTKTINRLVQRLKGQVITERGVSSDGNVWDALKTLPNAYLHIVGTSEDHWLTNLLDPSRKLTKVGAPTFVSNKGVSHTSANDHYLSDVTLASLSGKNVSFGSFTNAAGTAADGFETGALDGGSPSAGLAIGAKGSTTQKLGGRALSGNFTPPGNADYWSGEGVSGINVDGATAYLSHHGKRVDSITRAGTQTFTSTNAIRVLGATGSTATTARQVSCVYLGGLLTADQESWLAACIRNALEDIQNGDIDLFNASEGPSTLTVDYAVVGCTLQGVIGANILKELDPTASTALLGTDYETRVMHIGGMSRGGLTYVDSNAFSNTAINGRYRDVLTYINTEIYGGADTTSQAGLGVDPKFYGYAVRRMLDPTRTGSTSKINGQSVPVYLSRGVRTITGDVGSYTITMRDGRVVTAKYILGAEFEGILLKKFPAIQTITGTEAFVSGAPNSGSQESYNGYKGATPAYLFYPKNKANNDAIARIDPYVTAGNPASGLLPLIETLPNIPINDPDPVSQPMNQRHSVTNSLGRYVPWPTTAPTSYDPAEWEVNFRWYAQQPTINRDSICVIRPGRSPVFDMNNAGPLSTDKPGSGIAYTNAVAADEAAGTINNALAVRQEVMRWGKCFFWHVLGSGDPRVPTALRDSMNLVTMDATQFCDPDPLLGETLHWAPANAVYVRDPVYRMVRSDVLPYSGQDANLTDGSNVRPAGRTAGMAAYWVDRHIPRRIALDDGQGMVVVGQGEYFVASGGQNLTTPVAYDHIIPQKTACKGMVHALAANTTAVGWSQIRMEPALSHLTEFGACALIVARQAGNIAVQDVDYATVAALATGGHDKTTLVLNQVG